MVIWNIGLSRAGKTTISRLLYDELKPHLPNLVLLDGDTVRELFKNDVDHSIEGRRRNAERLSHLTKFLSDQGIHVIAAVLSIFPEWQKWNRDNIKDYHEVYIRASMDTLLRRDSHGLYQGAQSGSIKNVVGFDIPFPEPNNPDLIIDNNDNLEDFSVLLKPVLSMPVIREFLQQ